MDIKMKEHILEFDFGIDFTKLIEDSKNPEKLKSDIKYISKELKPSFKDSIKAKILKTLYQN